MANNHIIGIQGEKTAENYVKSIGMSILAKNYRCIYGEIDIIAKDNNCIVFIEVKYRKNTNYGYPLEAVNDIKQQKIKKTALYYIAQNNIECNIRFDAIGILCNNITHIKNAF